MTIHFGNRCCISKVSYQDYAQSVPYTNYTLIGGLFAVSVNVCVLNGLMYLMYHIWHTHKYCNISSNGMMYHRLIHLILYHIFDDTCGVRSISAHQPTNSRVKPKIQPTPKTIQKPTTYIHGPCNEKRILKNLYNLIICNIFRAIEFADRETHKYTTNIVLYFCCTQYTCLRNKLLRIWLFDMQRFHPLYWIKLNRCGFTISVNKGNFNPTEILNEECNRNGRGKNPKMPEYQNG